jgi:hypothetical protein
MDEDTVRRAYRDIVARFVNGGSNAKAFETEFLAARRELAAQGIYPTGPTAAIIDELFYDVDAYTDVQPLGEHDIDGDALYRSAAQALAALERPGLAGA